MTKGTAGATARATSRAKDLISILSRILRKSAAEQIALAFVTGLAKDCLKLSPDILAGHSETRRISQSLKPRRSETGADYSYKLNTHHGRDHFLVRSHFSSSDHLHNQKNSDAHHVRLSLFPIE